MKKLLLLLALLLPIGAIGQPILRNTATTNNPPLFFFSFPGPGVGGTVANPVFADSSNLVWQLDGSLTDVHLHLTNIFGNVTNTYNTIITTNNFFISGKGNTLVITNNLTILTNGSLTLSNLTAPAVLVLGTNRNVTNATLSGLTLSDANVLTATGSSGASVWVPLTTLTYSTTNVTMDASGGTNFFVLLTNSTTFMAAPSNPPGSTSTNTSWTVFFQQDSTGTRAVTWTNLFKGPQFQPLTNANAVSSVTVTTSALTNGQYYLDYGVYGLQ